MFKTKTIVHTLSSSSVFWIINTPGIRGDTQVCLKLSLMLSCICMYTGEASAICYIFYPVFPKRKKIAAKMYLHFKEITIKSQFGHNKKSKLLAWNDVLRLGCFS